MGDGAISGPVLCPVKASIRSFLQTWRVIAVIGSRALKGWVYSIALVGEQLRCMIILEPFGP